MRRLACLALAALVLASPPLVRADARLPRGAYAELGLGASGVRHSELDFVSPLAGVGVGAFVLPGIGLELFAEAALERGEDGRFEAGIERAVGVAARFQSAPVGGLEGYVTVGYVDLTLVQESLDGDGEIDERFGGARFGVGLAQRLARAPALALGIEYRNFRVDDALLIDGIVLGLRARFR